MKLYALLSLFLIPFLKIDAPNTHDFHVSRCIIDYSETDQALQISLHIFIDDLEAALRLQGADKLFVGTELEVEKAATYIERYLQQCLQLQVNGQAVSYTYLGKETTEDLAAIWCYVEVTEVGTLKELNIKNDLLLEVHNDQKNIIQITGPDKKEGYFLFYSTYNEDKVIFK